MKTGSRTTVTVTIIGCLIAGTMLAGEDAPERSREGKGFAGHGELKAYRMKQRKERREHAKERQEEVKAFRESLKGKEAAEALPLIIDHRNGAYEEMKAAMEGFYTDYVAYAKEVFAKHEVPAEKQDAYLSKMAEHHDEMVGEHDERHATLISALEALKGSDDLTMEQIKSVMREHAPERRGHRGREGKEGGKGRGRGRGKDDGVGESEV